MSLANSLLKTYCVIWQAVFKFLQFCPRPGITLNIHPQLEPMLRRSGGTALLLPHAFMAWAGMALPFPSLHIGFLVLYVFSDHIFNIRYHAHQITVAAMSAEYHILNSNLYYVHISFIGNRFCFHS
jgi:hypothetical protein